MLFNNLLVSSLISMSLSSLACVISSLRLIGICGGVVFRSICTLSTMVSLTVMKVELKYYLFGVNRSSYREFSLEVSNFGNGNSGGKVDA